MQYWNFSQEVKFLCLLGVMKIHPVNIFMAKVRLGLDQIWYWCIWTWSIDMVKHGSLCYMKIVPHLGRAFESTVNLVVLKWLLLSWFLKREYSDTNLRLKHKLSWGFDWMLLSSSGQKCWMMTEAFIRIISKVYFLILSWYQRIGGLLMCQQRS